MAGKKGSKGKEAKKGKAMGAVPGEETAAKADEVKVSKDKNSIEAPGKFVVVEVSKDNFRMFNELGQAVSPVVNRADTLENGKPALARLIRDASRSNALIKQRTIKTPKGHEEVK